MWKGAGKKTHLDTHSFLTNENSEDWMWSTGMFIHLCRPCVSSSWSCLQKGHHLIQGLHTLLLSTNNNCNKHLQLKTPPSQFLIDLAYKQQFLFPPPPCFSPFFFCLLLLLLPLFPGYSNRASLLTEINCAPPPPPTSTSNLFLSPGARSLLKLAAVLSSLPLPPPFKL